MRGRDNKGRSQICNKKVTYMIRNDVRNNIEKYIYKWTKIKRNSRITERGRGGVGERDVGERGVGGGGERRGGEGGTLYIMWCLSL